MTRTRLLVCAVLAVLVLGTALAGCKQTEPNWASLITEITLRSLNDGNYADFSQHFDDAMKQAIPEAAFAQLRASMKSKVGDYVPNSREFVRLQQQGAYTTLTDAAGFTSEPAGVTVRLAFQNIGGRMLMSGLWFDSPKLRQ